MTSGSRLAVGTRVRVALVNLLPVYQEGVAAIIRQEPRLEIVARLTHDDPVASRLLQEQPDLIVYSLPRLEPAWLAELSATRQACPWAYLLALTDDGIGWSEWSRRAGVDRVRGYPGPTAEFLTLVTGAAAEIDRLMVDDVFARIVSLSPSLRRVAALLCTGATNPQIAERLALSRHTVESHIATLFGTFGVSGRTALGIELARRRRPSSGEVGQAAVLWRPTSERPAEVFG